MSHITRGNSNGFGGNLLVSSSMKEDFFCPNCKDTKIVESYIPEVGNEECYYCKDQE